MADGDGDGDVGVEQLPNAEKSDNRLLAASSLAVCSELVPDGSKGWSCCSQADHLSASSVLRSSSSCAASWRSKSEAMAAKSVGSSGGQYVFSRSCAGQMRYAD